MSDKTQHNQQPAAVDSVKPDVAAPVANEAPNSGKLPESVSPIAPAPPARVDTLINASEKVATEPQSLVVPAPQPKVLGRYTVIAELGRGGMGAVYLAQDSILKRKVALKIPQFEPHKAEQMQARFLREAQMVAQLSHPNICQVYDVGIIDAQYVMAMEYIEGKTLGAFTKTGKLLNERHAVVFIKKVALAVEAAHQKGLIHRDLKPGNIMLPKPDPVRKVIEPKVMDFGLAKSLDARTSELTKSGMIVGTPCYMSKEQWSGKEAQLGPECDVYSLGVILYELLTGKMPYDVEAEDPATAWFVKLVTQPQILPSERKPGFDAELEQIVMRAIAKEPQDRYPSMAEFARELDAWLKSRATTQRNNDGAYDAVPPDEKRPSKGGAGPARTPITQVLPAAEVEESAYLSQPNPNRSNSQRSPLDKFPVWALWAGGVGLALLFGIVIILISTNGEFVDTATRQNDPSFNSTSLETELAEYYRDVQTGRGSVVFLQKAAPARFTSWQQLANEEDPIAQLFVGRCYQEGIMVPRDYAAANAWLNKSATQGNHFAMHTLGLAHEVGQGVAANRSEALGWYTKAANLGNTVSMRAVGILYEAGITRDKPQPEIALTWYKKAADAGDPVACRFVGNCYAFGSGTQVNLPESELWYKKAADAGDVYRIGLNLGNQLAPQFAAYLVADASDSVKISSINQLTVLEKEFQKLDIASVATVFSASQLNMATTGIMDLKPDDPLRVINDRLTQRYVTLFSAATTSQRTSSISSFSKCTATLVDQWRTERQYEEIVDFWRRCYKDIALADLKGGTEEFDALLGQIRWILPAMILTGHRKEAEELMSQALDLCDWSLKEHPWDWYLKDAYSGLCFETANAWNELGEPAEVQMLLRRGWEVRLKQFGKEALLASYPVLPLKGKVPAGASAADREFFERFLAADGEKSTAGEKKTSGMTRFTISCHFGDKKYPFHVYVLSGPRGYAELLDQFRWLHEFRGGEVPADVKESFLKLNTIAVDNKVDFRELCVYALGKAADDATEIGETEEATGTNN